MIKNIKTKETIKDIKTLDKKKMLDSFNKKQSINTKNNVQDKKENKESNYAINKIKGASEKTLVSARIKIKKYRNQKRKNEKLAIQTISSSIRFEKTCESVRISQEIESSYRKRQ